MKNLYYIFFILSFVFLFCFISTDSVLAQNEMLAGDSGSVSSVNYNVRRVNSSTAHTAGTRRISCDGYSGNFNADLCVNQAWEDVRAKKKARREAKRRRQQ